MVRAGYREHPPGRRVQIYAAQDLGFRARESKPRACNDHPGDQVILQVPIKHILHRFSTMHAHQLVLPPDHVFDGDASQRVLTRFLTDATARPVIVYTAEEPVLNLAQATDAAAGKGQHRVWCWGVGWHTGYLSYIPKDTQRYPKIPKWHQRFSLFLVSGCMKPEVSSQAFCTAHTHSHARPRCPSPGRRKSSA